MSIAGMSASRRYSVLLSHNQPVAAVQNQNFSFVEVEQKSNYEKRAGAKRAHNITDFLLAQEPALSMGCSARLSIFSYREGPTVILLVSSYYPGNILCQLR